MDTGKSRAYEEARLLRAAYDALSEPPHMRKRHRMRDVRASGKKERLLLF